MRAESLTQAYLWYLDELLNRPTFRNAPRGYRSQEILGANITLLDPLRRVITIPCRRSNIVFNFAEALWYFAGRDDLDYLSYYAPHVRRFLSGADEVTGTAYGPRIFRYGPTEIDQWQSITRTLSHDPDSKRAVLQISQPDELLTANNPDVACTIALQFLIRREKLHLIGYMRANDAYRGLVSDVFSFTILQELMACQLGLSLGTYTHIVGSLHLYDPDVRSARQVYSRTRLGALPDDLMPAMPGTDQREHVTRLMELEAALRTNTHRLGATALNELPLPAYWKQVAILFELYRQVRHGAEADAVELLRFLHPVYSHMIVARFPELFSGLEATEVAS